MARIKVLPGGHNSARQKIMNAQSSSRTADAASGEWAAREAYEREAQNKASKEFGMSRATTVKITTNPVKPGGTRIGNLAGLGGILGKHRK